MDRTILCSHSAPQLFVSSGHADRLHLIEELRTYCKPGLPLHNCQFLFLFQLAHTIYLTYGTTEAAAYAQHHNTKSAQEFFGMHALNVPTPHLGSFPQSSPSPDLDNGISFINPDDSDDNGDTDDSNQARVPASDSIGNDVQPTPLPDDSEGETLLYNNVAIYSILSGEAFGPRRFRLSTGIDPTL